MKLLWKILVLMGVLILIYAFNMSVSMDGADVVNMHLLSNRQNYTILGGILFLAGIILYATSMVKGKQEHDSKNQNEVNETVSYTEAASVASDKIINTADKIIPKLVSMLQKTYLFIIGVLPFSHLLVRKDEGWKSISIRLIVGFVIGKITSNCVYYWLLSIFFEYNPDRKPGDISIFAILLTDIAPILIISGAVLYALKIGKMLDNFVRLLLVSLAIVTVPTIWRLVDNMNQGFVGYALSFMETPVVLLVGLIAVYLYKRTKR